MENVNVSGEFGRKPTLEFTDSTPSDELLVEVLHEGDGQVVMATVPVVFPRREFVAAIR